MQAIQNQQTLAVCYKSVCSCIYLWNQHTEICLRIIYVFVCIMYHNYKNVAAATNGMCKNIQRNSSSHDHWLLQNTQKRKQDWAFYRLKKLQAINICLNYSSLKFHLIAAKIYGVPDCAGKIVIFIGPPEILKFYRSLKSFI